ncbi:MAG: thiamine diphosphokinase [Dysgonamonadaceae bacterium]|jgi:thiamine pyrophosphokinase|nr:thiamine diphosphokinase [Dysgonamonadaceae bacterium]
MIPLLQEFYVAVLADGEFPKNNIPLDFLWRAKHIICCDGAVENLLKFGRNPDFIVGDCDSISDGLKQRFKSILYQITEQETNDLTKAVNFCFSRGWDDITVLGATGKREDHTLGNLSLIADYAEKGNIQLLTDYGVFVPQLKTAVYESVAGQQVSIFSLNTSVPVTAHGLVYNIDGKRLDSWWNGTLNEAATDNFIVEITDGKLLVFREYIPFTGK